MTPKGAKKKEVRDQQLCLYKKKIVFLTFLEVE